MTPVSFARQCTQRSFAQIRVDLRRKNKNYRLLLHLLRAPARKIHILHRLPNSAPAPSTVDLDTCAHAVPSTARRRKALANMLFHDVFRLVALQLALLIWIDEPMNRTVVEDALFSVVFALSFRLGPGVAIKLRMAFASRTLFARIVSILLDERNLTCLTFNPFAVLCTK